MDKLIYHNFQYYETDEVEHYLIDMEEEGYIFSGMKGNFLMFSRLSEEKGKYSYKVIYNIGRNINEMIENMKRDGWEFVCQNGYLIIFRTIMQFRKNNDQVSEREKYEMIRNIRRKKVLLVGFLFALIAVFLCHLYIVIMKKYDFTVFSKEFFINSFAFIIGTAFLLSFLIYYIAELYDYIVWNKMARSSMGKSITVRYERTNFKKIMFRLGDLYKIAVVLFGVIFGIYILLETASWIITASVVFTWIFLTMEAILYNLRMKGSFVYLSYMSIIAYGISFGVIDVILSQGSIF
ncbi:DUF2812 domain-containing protein [Sporanaerobacter acetigenes]|uniref:DUF2812 domain-containing protein n=1 Tax=Sporanaerobacter acetigenes DSM 13106 TaxID=1123281 RepID=A0A1M5VNG4_9FIRM|nr:DUF2812 domain-containing protein [Sporanaerobacter acetigenes]SHH76463.1 Protein of unknown function [Sporanaerobacter acetigenes DSM 13106]